MKFRWPFMKVSTHLKLVEKAEDTTRRKAEWELRSKDHDLRMAGMESKRLLREVGLKEDTIATLESQFRSLTRAYNDQDPTAIRPLFPAPPKMSVRYGEEPAWGNILRLYVNVGAMSHAYSVTADSLGPDAAVTLRLVAEKTAREFYELIRKKLTADFVKFAEEMAPKLKET